MKILYAAQLSPNDSALYRMWALERLGHTVVPLNSYDYQPQSELLRKIVHRAADGTLGAAAESRCAGRRRARAA